MEEVKINTNETNSVEGNKKKNRATLIVLFVIFFTPVMFAYVAYFNGWFLGSAKNYGELIATEQILDIEDFEFVRADDSTITGEEFETIYWWILPIDATYCDQACVELNLYTINQTYVGLGKEAQRINALVVLPKDSVVDVGEFPKAYSEFSNTGIKALEKTHSGLNKDLPANTLYLVDPLGNIFMKYPMVKDKESAPIYSKGIREDLRRLFKYSRLG